MTMRKTNTMVIAITIVVTIYMAIGILHGHDLDHCHGFRSPMNKTMTMTMTNGGTGHQPCGEMAHSPLWRNRPSPHMTDSLVMVLVLDMVIQHGHDHNAWLGPGHGNTKIMTMSVGFR